MVQRPDAILIAGPTASGKSGLAVKLAQKWDGEIVNADSMQIYPVLDILTARPEKSDLETVSHHLYGYAPIDEAYSAAKWLQDAKRAASGIIVQGKVPVFVGGTGLYFKALEGGLSSVPEIPVAIRERTRAELTELGSEALHNSLAALDPEGAVKLKPSDSHRISRALEVIRTTGKPLSSFHDEPDPAGLFDGKQVEKFILMPERPFLHEKINARTHLMMEQGAKDEVRALLALNLPETATVLKAIGVRQISEHLQGKISLETCIEQVQAATRQYAKRQSTWFRGQMSADWKIVSNLSELV